MAASEAKALPPTNRVILRVGNTEVTQAEFEAGIGAIEPEKEGPSEKERRDLGDDYASVLMLSQQALVNHLDSSPEISRQLAIERLQILSDAEFNSLMDQAKPSFEEVSNYYSAHLPDFEQVQIRRLFIWKRGAGSKNAKGLSPQDARSRADAILQTAAAGGDTAKLTDAFKDSDDGLLDAHPLTFPRGELPPQMEKVAFAIKEGQWSQVEDTPDSLILLHLIKRDRQQLGQVSSSIEKRLQGEKMQALLENLKEKSAVWMDKEYFGTEVAPVPGTQRSSNPPSKVQQSSPKGEINK